jgi:citrate lyase subunit beta / citryl-CoA lyase
MSAHPKDVLKGAQAGAFLLPAVDHYCGVEARILKALALQRQMIEERGACVFDVTLDCEDGAPVGKELEHAQMVVELVCQAPKAVNGVATRMAIRVHPVDHPAFAADVQTVVSAVGADLCHLMIPKVESVTDVEIAVEAVNAAGGHQLPLHVLVESAASVYRAFDIAAHPRVQSISFGLMDFVSAHGGALPASAMSVQGQFAHPHVLRAKIEIASACHAFGKVPSHCVVTEFKDAIALEKAARIASQELGYTRMWSIHPDQIAPILRAMAPSESEVTDAAEIVEAAHKADWAPISHKGKLHDRASYRYYWQLIERAHAAGQSLPESVRQFF